MNAAAPSAGASAGGRRMRVAGIAVGVAWLLALLVSTEVIPGPVQWWRGRGGPFGPVELEVVFPRDRPGRAQPLLVSGAAGQADYVYVVANADGRSVRLGYSHTGREPVASRAIPVDFSVPHLVGIRSGALLPGPDHAYFDGFTDEQVRRAKSRVEVTLDGVPYLELEQDSSDAGTAAVRFGRNDISTFTDPAFTGELRAVHRRELPAAIQPFAGGSLVRLAFRLPADANGKVEPLVATGTAGAGDLLTLTHESATTVRLELRHDGAAPLLSAPLALQPGELQLVEVSLGSFYPPGAGPASDLAAAAIVRWNGELVWAEERPFHAAGAGRPAIGKNMTGAVGVEAVFSGDLRAVQPVAFPELPAPAAGTAAARAGYGGLRVTVQFPRGLEGVFEPLVVAGTAVDRADYLWLRYLDAGSILIGYEHTGGGGPNSGPIALDLSRPHVLEVELPAFYPPEGDAFFAGWPRLRALQVKNRVRVVLDGVVRIDAPARGYEAPPAAVGVGENRLSDTFGRKFTGTLTGLERLAAPAQAGR
jgi:hypothetical protein